MCGNGSTEKSILLSINTAVPPFADKQFAAMRTDGGSARYSGDMGLLVSAVKTDADGRFFRLVGITYPVDVPPLDADSLAPHKGFGNLFSGRSDDPAEGLAGNSHLFSGIGMVHPFEIGKSEGFDFIDRQHDVLQPRRRNPFGQKTGYSGKLFDRTAVNRSAGARVFHRWWRVTALMTHGFIKIGIRIDSFNCS
jgi:hypothetical protein